VVRRSSPLLGVAVVLVVLQRCAGADPAPPAAATPTAQGEEVRQLRDHIAKVEGEVASNTGLRERVATLEGRLAHYDDHIKKVVDDSINSSDKIRGYVWEYVTYIMSAVVAVFGIGGGLFLLRLKGLQDRAKKRHDELQVATQVARAVGDLLRGDQVVNEEMKKVWWTSAFQKLSFVEEEGNNDPDWLNWRAYTLRRLKDVPKGLKMAKRAARIASARSPQRARAFYNIACYSALLGCKEEALDALREAVRAQPLNKAVAADDTDFKCVVEDDRFREQFAEIIHPEKIRATPST